MHLLFELCFWSVVRLMKPSVLWCDVYIHNDDHKDDDDGDDDDDVSYMMNPPVP